MCCDSQHIWLRHEVSEAYDALKANPERALSPEHVRQHLAQLRARQVST